MTNNDILRRLRYILQVGDAEMVEIFALSGESIQVNELRAWFQAEGEEGARELSDLRLCQFLDGLIVRKRGPRPDGKAPIPAEFISNNEILRKLRIAYEFREEDMLATFDKVEFVVTKAELGSFFRKEGHRNYRKCPEQVLRKFLQGLSQGVE